MTTDRLIEDFFWFRKYDRTKLKQFIKRKQNMRFESYLKRLKAGEKLIFNFIKGVIVERE